MNMKQLILPEPNPNPIAAQIETLWMLGFAYLGMGLASILTGYYAVDRSTAVAFGAIVPMIVFGVRFLSKMRGWDT